MATTIAASGSQTATLATDHTLTTTTAPAGGACYVAMVDIAALAGTEVVEITVQTRARVGDTLRVVQKASFGSTNIEKLVLSMGVPVEAGNDLVVILRQENGTGRAFPWALKRVDG